MKAGAACDAELEFRMASGGSPLNRKLWFEFEPSFAHAKTSPEQVFDQVEVRGLAAAVALIRAVL